MRTIRTTLAVVAVGAAAVMTAAAPATAAPIDTRTYQGEFAGTVDYQGCTTQAPADVTTSGSWAVTLHGTSAMATFNILVNDAPHVAYVFPSMKQAPVGPGTTFSVYGATQAGLLTATLTGDDFAYRIAPYDYDGLSCESVTYPGHLL